MKETDVRAKAFAMPLTSPAFPPGPYRFVNREYLIITYRTDPERLRAVVPEPLEVTEPVVKYEFIRMPDSTGFGDYTETGQVIPVSFQGRKGGYSHCMFLNDDPPISGGRELWGFPKKLASPSLRTEIDTLVLTQITNELKSAFDWLNAKAGEHGIQGPIIVTGWSAGGHLTSFILDHPKVAAGLAISGVFDLGALRDSPHVNDKVKLSEEEIQKLSPMRRPIVNKPLGIAYGTGELPAMIA